MADDDKNLKSEVESKLLVNLVVITLTSLFLLLLARKRASNYYTDPIYGAIITIAILIFGVGIYFFRKGLRGHSIAFREIVRDKYISIGLHVLLAIGFVVFVTLLVWYGKRQYMTDKLSECSSQCVETYGNFSDLNICNTKCGERYKR